MNIKRAILILALIITLALCGTVSAADTSSNNTNSSLHSLQSSASTNSTHNQSPDPVISGVIKDNSTNKGLANVTIRVLQNNTQVAQTTTHSDGTYSLNFINSNTSFIVIASKLGYMPSSKTITVSRSSNLSDPNFYGTANFRLYTLLKYSGSASSYVLNVGALPDILADIYAGKSSAWVNSTSSNYSKGGGTPLEVKLLTASLLSGLLNVYSTGDEGAKIGGLLPSSNSSLLSSLKLLGIDVGLLSATSNSSANPPQSSGSGEVASLDVGIKLLQLLDVLSLNADVITANSSVTPDFNTGILISTSNAGVANIALTLLGIPLLQIEALQSNAIASVSGKPGGATAKFTWKVADIKALGISILDDLTLNGHVNIGLLGINILTLSLGSVEGTTSTDGTYARASGDALRLQILGLLGGGLVNLVIGHAEAEAQVPKGGLHVNTSDLEINKTVNNSKPNYLQNVTYTIKVHNYGPDAASGVTVTDKLPAGLKFISANGNGIYSPLTGIWTIGNLSNGGEAILNIIAQVISSNTQINNIASVTEDNYDPEPGNDQSNVTVNVGPASDLAINKTVDNNRPNYLDKVIFTITAHNNGPDTAAGVVVIDKLPAGLKWISDDSNGAYNPTTGIWTIGNLTNNTDTILKIIAQITSSNIQITNIAGINGTNYDQNSTNNQSNTTINVDLASDLGITKTVNNSKPNYLQNVTFTLTAHNYGPDAATGATVTDKLPTGLKFISASGTGTYNPTTGIWTIGNLANGTTAVLNIIAQAITANTQVINTATINGANYDQNSSNDQSSAIVNIKSASDLGIKITVNNAHPQYKDYVTLTLTATNGGPNDAAYVKVYNTLPDKLKYISDDSNGAFDPTTGLWTIGYMANGATAVLHIIAQAVSPNVSLTDVARITDHDPVGEADFYDPNQDNDQASVSLDVGSADDLSITKTVNNSKPNYLQNVAYTLTAHNNGPNGATGVIVNDKLPAGLKLISTSGTGKYDSSTGIWTIGNLANGATAVLKIVAQVIASNTQLVNTAHITGSELDLNSSNDNSNATINIVPASDLGITKTVDNKYPKYLQKVTFTLTARNYGPNNATGVSVTDKLPAGLKFISANGTGKYDSSTGIWTIGNLANSATAVLKIVAQATTPNKELINTATIEGTNYDQKSDNNKGSASVKVGPAADLAVKMSVNNAHPKYKQKVTFTITAYNYGPMNAKNVTVTLKMPKGFKYVSKDKNIKYNYKTGVWTIGNLKNGGKVVLHVLEQAVTSNVRLTSTATIKGTAIMK